MLGLARVSCRVWVQLSAARLKDYDCDSRSAQPRGLLHGLRALCLSRGLYAVPRVRVDDVTPMPYPRIRGAGARPSKPLLKNKIFS